MGVGLESIAKHANQIFLFNWLSRCSPQDPVTCFVLFGQPLTFRKVLDIGAHLQELALMLKLHSCNTQHDGSAAEKQDFPMPIIGSVLRSRCGPSYPCLSVRYILPLSNSKSHASFILTGGIITLNELPNAFRDLLESVVENHV